MKAIKSACRLSDSPMGPVDFTDSFTVDIAGAPTAMEAAQGALGRMPGWVGRLMALRNLIVAPLGLKHDTRQFATGAKFVGAFPVISETSERIVMGFDDKHLDFRVTIDVRSLNTGSRITASTWVKTHNAFGRFYLACVMPFHNLIVPTALNQLINDPAVPNP